MVIIEADVQRVTKNDAAHFLLLTGLSVMGKVISLTLQNFPYNQKSSRNQYTFGVDVKPFWLHFIIIIDWLRRECTDEMRETQKQS